MKSFAQSLALAEVRVNIWNRLRTVAQSAFRQRRGRKLRVCETLALGDKRQLMIVECGERRLLIGAAGNFLATLTELGEGRE